MLALPELQAAIGQSITSAAPIALLELIASNAAEAPARLSVYRNNVLSRLTKTLRAAFPVVCQLVDERFFDYAADAYVRAALPTAGCLCDYGATFPAFIAGFPPASAIAYLPDVASLEWCIQCALRAAPLPTLTIDALADRPGDPAVLRLRMAPWLRYLSSSFNVDQIWAAHQPESLSTGVRLESINLALQVHGLDGLTLSRLTPATLVFRSSLASGKALAAATAVTMKTFPQFDLAADLSALFSEGCVVGFDTGDYL